MTPVRNWFTELRVNARTIPRELLSPLVALSAAVLIASFIAGVYFAPSGAGQRFAFGASAVGLAAAVLTLLIFAWTRVEGEALRRFLSKRFEELEGKVLEANEVESVDDTVDVGATDLIPAEPPAGRPRARARVQGVDH